VLGCGSIKVIFGKKSANNRLKKDERLSEERAFRPFFVSLWSKIRTRKIKIGGLFRF
jgi:hypothetical protein